MQIPPFFAFYINQFIHFMIQITSSVFASNAKDWDICILGTVDTWADSFLTFLADCNFSVQGIVINL